MSINLLSTYILKQYIMPDPIEQGFVMSLISFPPNKKISVPLVQPSDKEIKQKPSVPSLDCTVGFFCWI